MGRQYDAISADLREWIEGQPLFFVATAPSGDEGHLNVSPKGGKGTLRVLGPTTVGYLDLNGSGIETVAHLRENGRICLMWCAFAGPPKIVRMHGRGRVVQEDETAFAALAAGFSVGDDVANVRRSVVVVEVERIADSCGFVVPRMAYTEERSQLYRWAEKRERDNGADWKRQYQLANNLASIDGLPGLDLAGDLDESSSQRLTSAGRVL